MLKELAELEMQFLKRIFAHSSKKSLSFHVVVRYIIDLVPRYNIDLHIHSCIVVIVPESHNAFFFTFVSALSIIDCVFSPCGVNTLVLTYITPRELKAEGFAYCGGGRTW